MKPWRQSLAKDLAKRVRISMSFEAVVSLSFSNPRVYLDDRASAGAPNGARRASAA
jgi:hypothetical protein